ncbi:MAG: hypothetical protein IPK72_07275 [Candidatus Eisenbacteria bacterium]|nr:hypothetical protein [Candidatus Eisenbacteria bacterium]
MKPAQLRGFVSNLLTSHGATTREVGAHLLEVTAPPKLAQRLGPSELVLAFHPNALRENPRSELATVGNPVFERILDMARETGRSGQRFFASPPKRRGTPDPAKALGEAGEKLGPPEAVYTPIYFFLWKIEYSLEDVPDELETIPVDGITHESWKETPDLLEFWDELASEPAEGRRIEPAFPIPEPVIDAAIRTLEKTPPAPCRPVRSVSEGHLERETESIRQYYEQLIHEARNVGRRWNSSTDERTERIRLLQLDWKRRIEEAQQFWRPELDIRLSAVGAAQRPRLRYAPAKGKRSGNGVVYYDEIEQCFLTQVQSAPAADGGKPLETPNAKAPRARTAAGSAGARSPRSGR